MILARPVPAGMWTHVAVTFTAATSMMASTSTARSVGGYREPRRPVADQHPPLAHRRGHGGGSLFIGAIDEPRIFNRALGADEIQTLFWQGTNCQ